MKDDNEIFESLIAGGVIGAALGALLSKESGKGSLLGAIAGAAILATFKANEDAKKTNITMYVEEDGYLYKILPGGLKTKIRKLEKPAVKLQEHFKLI
jgi:hypothetical protein